jgi:DNA polymerase
MGCPPVLSRANGPFAATVLFVGEAPGRLGAGRTGIPMSGDVSGIRFDRLLGVAGLQRGNVFVTNALLCLPLDSSGRNRRPRPQELRSCSAWLRETIRMVDPGLVVSMGGVALEALRRIEPHQLSLKLSGQRPVTWNGRLLAAVYHPGARAQVHRSWPEQEGDWRNIGSWVTRLEGQPRPGGMLYT